MTRKAILALAVAVLAIAPAQARHYKHPRRDSQVASHCVYGNTAVIVCGSSKQRTGSLPRVAVGGQAIVGNDPRPRAWCGWWLRHELGVASRLYNLARAWAHYGSRASGPAPGVIAVYPHHVGIVISVPGPGRMVMKSGNDGHAVRTRERSTRGVIAWRWPPNRMASND